MSDEKVVVPTGFIEVIIELDEAVSVSLAFVRSSVLLFNDKGVLQEAIPLPVGETRAIALRPGKYLLSAALGSLTSESVTVEVEAGQVKNVVFHFGKGPQ